MIELKWQALDPYSRPAGKDPWPVTEPWRVACENLPAAAKYLRLKATGLWTPMSGLQKCGPDGLVGQTFPADRLFISDCAVASVAPAWQHAEIDRLRAQESLRSRLTESYQLCAGVAAVSCLDHAQPTPAAPASSGQVAARTTRT